MNKEQQPVRNDTEKPLIEILSKKLAVMRPIRGILHSDTTTGEAATQDKTGYNYEQTEFPALGTKHKVSAAPKKETVQAFELEKVNKKRSKLLLSDFLCTRKAAKKSAKTQANSVEPYGGNTLDADRPVRMRGKHREEPKLKKPSKLKHRILLDKTEATETDVVLLRDTHLCRNVITEELNQSAKSFIAALVALQEKFYKRDPLKAAVKRRYVVGLHETKKYLNLKKAKVVFLAADVKFTRQNDSLMNALEDIVNLAKSTYSVCMVVLKRRLLGSLTLKNLPVTCLAVLNCEGLEEHYNEMLRKVVEIKEKSHEISTGNTLTTV